jgi:uncharacterized protein YbjT (DUF2867 family)
MLFKVYHLHSHFYFYMRKQKILLTGATGYIGKRLLPVLAEQDYEIYCLVRDARRFEIPDNLKEKVKVYEADLLHPETLTTIPNDFDAAYYLVHSMTSSTRKFHEMEKKSAENFRQFVETGSCRQVIYLGGIATSENLSKHLESRKNVKDILAQSGIPLTSLGAAIIVGSGSASFEIIRDIVEKLPVMVTPRWLNTKSRPIAIRDAVAYLTGVLLREECYNQHYDIGGPEILTYKEMLLRYARVRGLKRLIITLPVLTPRLSAYWLNLVTATPYKLAFTLVNSMATEVISNDNRLQKLLGIEPTNYETAIRRAFDIIAQHSVVSSWKDAMASSMDDGKVDHYIEVPVYGCFKDEQKFEISGDTEKVVQKIFSIGGKNGWYYGNFLWKIRGLMDSMIGGVGLRRGRKNPDDLAAGDALDFWRVIAASRKNKRLLLYAEMKLPGDAWLEFRVVSENGASYLRQTATFRPRGISGRLYWYASFPFHIFIFKGMAKRITEIP